MSLLLLLINYNQIKMKEYNITASITGMDTKEWIYMFQKSENTFECFFHVKKKTFYKCFRILTNLINWHKMVKTYLRFWIFLTILLKWKKVN